MAPRISLALVLHNHQPVGNFGWVIADVHDRAYRPMLDALDRHPGVRLGLHYSGPLIEWLRRERPEFLERLHDLVARGQVELLGGGYYEPVLASLPERDRRAQLARMADELQRIGGRRPRGAWLAERVWEPDLPNALVAAGYDWTILDDNHFRAAAIPDERLWGPYTTDDQGNLLTVFGTEKGLRYGIPFGEVDDVIGHLRASATEDGERIGMMGDDGEKFGAWPTTYEHCWGATRWVDRFFEALEANAGWLTTVTPSDWLAGHPPIGRVYLPTASYVEMGEWVLPPTESRVFGGLIHAAEATGAPEYPFLRGGFWRNFQVKYREVNDLHKQMLRTSAKVAAMPDGPAKATATDHLHQGQSNDCYWHGLFGGIYISHMRLATYEHLIAAEDAADRSARARSAAGLGAAGVGAGAATARVDGVRMEDVDLDGLPEVVLATEGQVVTVKPSEGAGIGAWDIRPVRHALAAVLRRRPEASHATLLDHERRLAKPGVRAAAGGDPADMGLGDGSAGAAAAAGPAGAGRHSDATGSDEGAADTGVSGGGVGSIHELVSTKEAGLAGRLHYDAHERRSGLVHLFPPGTTASAFARAEAEEWGDFVAGPFAVESTGEDERRPWARLWRDGVARTPGGELPVRVEKTIAAGGGRRTPSLALDVRVENRGSGRLEALLAVEWATTMLGGGGNPAAYYLIDGARVPHDSTTSRASVARLRSGNEYVGLDVATEVEPAAETWISSIDTISTSEAGFERVYQGSALVLSWPLSLGPGASARFRVAHTVATTRDRAVEEGL